LDPEWTRQAWSNINLTNHHEDITNSLRIIEGKISQVSTNVSSIDKLVPIVRLEGSPEPITLRSMGDGMVHVFNLALALVNSKDGILLVDEIENGLHYSVLEDFWKFLIKSAQALDVQVFATTHSWDCVEAFQKAACEDRSSDGYLIRLGWRKDEIVATVYDENDLAIVTRDQIEVR
jgi:AAA15 family ATPase/GTPase